MWVLLRLRSRWPVACGSCLPSSISGERRPRKGPRRFGAPLRVAISFRLLLHSDADKDDSPRLRPALPTLDVAADTFTFDEYEGFRDYWKPLLHKGAHRPSANIRLVRTEGRLCRSVGRPQAGPALRHRFSCARCTGALMRQARVADRQEALSPPRRPMGTRLTENSIPVEDRFGLACQVAGKGNGR